MGLGHLRAASAVLTCALVAACASAPPSVATPHESAWLAPPAPVRARAPEAAAQVGHVATPFELLPAGICTFPRYFSYSEACEGVPALTHAVLLADVADASAAETWVARYVGKLAPGYPMVLTSDELPLAGTSGRRAVAALLGDGIAPPPSRSIRVVAGFFASDAAAHRFDHAALGDAGQVVAIGGPPAEYPGHGDYEAFERRRHVAVEIIHPAPAYSDVDVQSVSAGRGIVPDGARWEERLTPLCTVRAGQVFEVDRQRLYSQSRRLAPVTCGPVRAWVAWTATRLESIVRVEQDGAYIHQIVDVVCDSATIERSAFVFGAPLPAPSGAKGRCRS